jgi:hypothetical protein
MRTSSAHSFARRLGGSPFPYAVIVPVLAAEISLVAVPRNGDGSASEARRAVHMRGLMMRGDHQSLSPLLASHYWISIGTKAGEIVSDLELTSRLRKGNG